METDNVVLEHLRAIRADLADLKEGQREIVRHISLRSREYAQDGDLVAHTQQMVRLEAEVDRIKGPGAGRLTRRSHRYP